MSPPGKITPFKINIEASSRQSSRYFALHASNTLCLVQVCVSKNGFLLIPIHCLCILADLFTSNRRTVDCSSLFKRPIGTKTPKIRARH